MLPYLVSKAEILKYKKSPPSGGLSLLELDWTIRRVDYS